MSTYWRPLRRIIYDAPSQWPAEVEVRFAIRPSDFFGNVDEREPKVTMNNGETSFEISGPEGKIRIKNTDQLSCAKMSFPLEIGKVTIDGNVATLVTTAETPTSLALIIQQVEINLSLYLSTQVGIYFDISEIAGTIGGEKLVALWEAGSYSTQFAFADSQTRDSMIIAAFSSPGATNPSFARFVSSVNYFHHALRFLSPLQVSYVFSKSYPEVILNLTKSLDALAPSRDKLRKLLLKLGYSTDQIESQIIPIGLVRNHFDVGHCVLSRPSNDDLALMRKFVDRATVNVSALLRLISDRLATEPDLLEPVREAPNKDRQNLIRDISEYLAHPPISTSNTRPWCLTTSTTDSSGAQG